MWQFTDEEIIKLQNRMNDVWKERIGDNFQRCVDRLLGTLDSLLTPSHYYKSIFPDFKNKNKKG